MKKALPYLPFVVSLFIFSALVSTLPAPISSGGGGGGSGETNTASNIGTAGVGVYDSKLGVDLRFRNVNAGSTKVTVTDDSANDEIDVDADGGLILDGEVSGNGVVTRTAAETYTNRSIAATANETTVADGDGVAGNPTVGIADNAILPGSGSATMPTGGVIVPGQLNLDTATELTIATGAITATKSHHTVDTESDAASDDLDTISGGTQGDVLLIRPANGARTVVVKNGTGNIICGADISLDDASDTATLAFDGSNWLLQADAQASGGGGGEANTASNIGVAGTGPFDAKVGVDLQFRNINAGSTKITITDDSANNEIDVDADGGLILDGEVAGNGLVTRTAAETYTNRSVAATTNETTVADGDGVAGNPTVGLADNLIMPGSGSATTPTGGLIVPGQLNLDTATELTIATGAITVTKSHHTVDTESDAASDDLDTISGGTQGDVVLLRAINAARTVVVKNGTGNIVCGADISLDDATDTATLAYDGTNWLLQADSQASGGGGGETNTASNVGVGGVGPFDAKVGVDLQFRNINNTADETSVTDDSGNNEIDIGIADNPVFPGTEGVQIPSGTTAQRPGTPVNGDLRYNTTTSKLEVYEAGAWTNVVGGGGTDTIAPIFPNSSIPVTADRVFANVHVGAGASSKHEQGLGVEASLGADSIWRLRFWLPNGTLPSGTGKLRLFALANATTGAAKVNAKWASVAAEENPSSATLNAEGTSTLTWGAGDNDQYKELEITLDADTLVAGEVVVMDLTFETTSWTLAAVSTWFPMIIWE